MENCGQTNDDSQSVISLPLAQPTQGFDKESSTTEQPKCGQTNDVSVTEIDESQSVKSLPLAQATQGFDEDSSTSEQPKSITIEAECLNKKSKDVLTYEEICIRLNDTTDYELCSDEDICIDKEENKKEAKLDITVQNICNKAEEANVKIVLISQCKNKFEFIKR